MKKIILLIMALVLVQSAMAYHSNDSSYDVYHIFSGGGIVQNSSHNISDSIGQSVIGDILNRTEIGLWYLWNPENTTAVTLQIVVEVMHPNSTEKTLQYLFNVSWTVANSSNYNVTAYLIHPNGTVVQTIEDSQNLLNTILNAQAQNKGLYKINVSVVDLTDTTIQDSDISTTFKISRDEQMEIAIMMAVGLVMSIFAVLTVVSQAAFLRLLFAFLMCGTMIIITNLARIIAEDYSANASLISMLNAAYYVVLWCTYILAAIVFVYGIYKAFNLLKESPRYLRHPPRDEKNEFEMR